jgi:RND superfamily putative drug exporter
MVSIFKTLAEAITRRPWAFIAFWLVVLAISIPLVGVFTSHLQYDTQKFIPKDLGALVAKDKYDQQFPGDYKNQILVVVQSDNNTTSMHYIDDLDSRVKNDTSIANLTGTSSIYTIQRDTVVNMTPDLYHSLYDAFDNASDGNRALYNATDTVLNSSNNLFWLWDNVTKANSDMMKADRMIVDSSSQLYAARDQIVAADGGLFQIKGLADIVDGVPAYYYNEWLSTNSSWPDTERSQTALQSTSDFINGSMPTQSRQMALGYLQQFYTNWNSTAPSSRNPESLKQTSAQQYVAYLYGSHQIDSQEQGIMLGIASGLSLADYGDPSKVEDFCVNTTTTDPAQKQQLYSIYDTLGPTPTNSQIDDFVLKTAASSMPGVDISSATDIYNLGRDPSQAVIGNYLVGKAIATLGDNASQDAKDVIQDAWDLGPAATQKDFDRYVLDKAEKGLNASDRQSVEEIFGWGPDPNDTVVSSYVLSEAGKDLNGSENQSLAEVYGLGRNASDDAVKSYVISKAESGLNLTSNTTYFMALLGLDRNLTDDRLKAFATEWEASHGYDDPKILPDSVVNNLAAGQVTLYMVSIDSLEQSQDSQNAVAAIRAQVADTLNESQYSGVKAYVTGSTAMSVDTQWSSMDDVNNIDKVTIALVLILLALYFRSFLTPIVPLIIIGVAIAASFGFMGILSTQIDIFYLVMTFMMVIMLGAGTDYCVFMLSRYAEERSKGAEIKEAVTAAVINAGKSIASSGSTAMIGFGSLTLIDQGIFRSIGIGTAICIFFCMLVALTLVPAVLTIAGDRLFWPRKLYKSGPGMTAGVWKGITSRVLKHSKLILILALVVSVPAVYIFSQLTLGDDFVGMMPNTVESKIGYDILNSGFGSGAFEKGMVVATLPENLKGADGNYTPRTLSEIEALSASLASTPGIDKVYSMTRPEGATINYDNLSSYKGAEQDYYRTYMDNSTGLDGRTTVLYVAFNGSPFSAQAQQSVNDLNAKLSAFAAGEGNGTTLLLGGGSVGTLEYQQACTNKYALVIPAVLLGIFIVLMLLLRSVFTPARLIVTLLMSITWTMGTFILVFQDWMQVSVYWILPIILFCVLMGLGVDYDIFLVSRIREEVFKGKTDEDAITHAVESTGTIITLCGAVMASAFGSMMISGTIMLKEFGFVLCLAIILDATLMRLVIVPAIMVLMKKYNWWMPFTKHEEGLAQLKASPVMEEPKK